MIKLSVILMTGACAMSLAACALERSQPAPSSQGGHMEAESYGGMDVMSDMAQQPAMSRAKSSAPQISPAPPRGQAAENP